MTRKKVTVLILIFIGFILLVLLLFFLNKQNTDLNKKELLSNDEIVTLLKKHGCDLIETTESPIAGNDLTNGSVLPGIYKMESSYDTYILIYSYDNYNNANDVFRNFVENSEADREDYFSEICAGKNVSVWMYTRNIFDAYPEAKEIKNNIFDILFEHAFQGETTIYEGNSENWTITIPVRHYRNRLYRDSPNIKERFYAEGEVQFKYKPGDIKSVNI